MCFFVFTGIHLLHVFVSLVFLGFTLYSIKQFPSVVSKVGLAENSASYWHIVDIL
ncbi:cytochrome c oxidase subunit 3 [Paraglaciecola chathamensis]|uniref:cytochrome c oxidase subunit 3 n=1 Tax=Paraglaciecola chathamensis TaxID=368405 RepID=UPI0039C947D3